MSLNHKQEKFVREYLIDRNATQAAIRAGYSAKTAHSQGPRLLDHVEISSALEKHSIKVLDKLDVTVERVLKERARMAFFDARKLFDDAGAPIHISQLDDDTAAAVAGLDVVTTGNADVGFATVLKVKLADKNASLTALEKHLGMYDDESGKEAPLHIHLHL